MAACCRAYVVLRTGMGAPTGVRSPAFDTPIGAPVVSSLSPTSPTYERQRSKVAEPLASMIDRGQMFAFPSCGKTWVPMAQFDPTDLSLRPQFREVAAELGGVLDRWEVTSRLPRSPPPMEGTKWQAELKSC